MRYHLLRRVTQGAVLSLFLSQYYLLVTWSMSIITGSLLSSRFLGVISFSDPFAAVEKIVSYKETIAFPLVAFVITVSLYGILGRVFCGWICPLDVAYSVVRKVRNRFRGKRNKMNKPIFDVKLSIIIFGTFLLLSALIELPIYTNYIYVITMFSIIANYIGQFLAFARFPSINISYAIFFLIVTLLVDALTSARFPRFWCRRMCPAGMLYGLFNKFSTLTIQLRPKLCNYCGICDDICRTGIEITSKYIMRGEKALRNIDCIKCFECVESCPKGVLTVSFAKPPQVVRFKRPNT